MTDFEHIPSAKGWRRSDRLALIVILAITALRVALLPFSSLQLHGDEAQYWSWAQKLDWGYFSKPPLIAWTIAATTGIFGDAEWAARLGSPLFHGLTAMLLYLIGKQLRNGTVGLWCAGLYLTLPSIFLSSGIISTDAPLLFFYALALLAALKLRAGARLRWAIIMGLAIGLGFLAKYAMIYFVLSLGLASLIDKPMRRAVLSWRGAISGALGLAILAPNLLWNASNDFATLSHTAANANYQGVAIHPLELAEFWVGQAGIFGPILLILLALALWASLRRGNNQQKLLLCFALVPLMIISGQALISRANANWAATAIIAALPLLVLWASARPRAKNWLKGGLIFNILFGSVVTFAALSPSFANAIGQANAVKRMRGWEATTNTLFAQYAAGYKGQAFDAIAVDNRLVFYDLTYYGRDQNVPLLMWPKQPIAMNHAEATAPLPETDQLVLLVGYYDDHEKYFREDFQSLTDIGEMKIDLGGGKVRHLRLYAARGFTRTDKVRE